ncbi:serine/threonine-protein kinase Sgk2 [Blumeria hordei DH14]|uniref:Serine/threonine-protein kinase Sgk2 n=1 Tax=Blumeria graminis f. sp. hordei (strain DH14) TaxID=546991 RepID=N1JG69_BLUG1|nr:serine/threonine-protein kinase Sgk2 [Blumeria hordei DH14]
MSQYKDLYEYTAQHPLEEILSRFRHGYENRVVISQIFYELIGYTLKFSHIASINVLAVQLFKFTPNILNNNVPISYFEKLIAMINSNGSDLDIWAEVISLANNFDHEPSGESQSVQDVELPIVRKKYTMTTITRNAQEKFQYDKTCDSLTLTLKSESANDVFKNVGNFWEVYFEKPRWSPITKRIWECYRDNNQCQPHIFKERMDESELHAWLYTFYDRYLKQFRTPHEANLDFFIEDVNLPDVLRHHWRDITVVGEFTKSPAEKDAKYHQLTKYIREIFYAQPLRRFVHGFVVHGLHAEFWILDRSGAYSSGEISLIENEEKLVRAISSYVFMSDEELGLDTTIRRVNGKSYIDIRDDKDSSEREIEIDPEPVSRPETMVSRANVCHRTKDENYMVKFSWGSGTKRSELDYLELAKPVNGVVDLRWSKDIHEVETHRAGLDFSTAFKVYFLDNEWRLSRGRHRKISISEPFFRKRKLTLALLSPNGRPLKSCRKLREFLNCILDAIIGHRDLYAKANVLHGDISEGNIILTRHDADGKSRGILIDLDMSTSVDGQVNETEKTKITGTVKYMAIELLSNMSEGNYSIEKSCRYDLESFFYVFLNGCLQYGCSREKPEYLKTWYTNNSSLNYLKKKQDIIENFETNILNHFSSSFDSVKDLARNLRKILFGENLEQFASTPDSGQLYAPIICAFKNVIRQIDEGHIVDEELGLALNKKRQRQTNSKGGSTLESKRQCER